MNKERLITITLSAGIAAIITIAGFVGFGIYFQSLLPTPLIESTANNEMLSNFFLTEFATPSVEGENFSQAGVFFIVSAMFEKEAAKDYGKVASKKLKEEDENGSYALENKSGIAHTIAAEILNRAAENFILAGDKESAAEAYDEAAKCYSEAMLHFDFALDEQKSEQAKNDVDRAKQRATDLRRR